MTKQPGILCKISAFKPAQYKQALNTLGYALSIFRAHGFVAPIYLNQGSPTKWC